MKPIVPIGTQTPYGKIAGVLFIGERYYLLINKEGVVALMPADVIEPKV
jgi:hypothetical protein